MQTITILYPGQMGGAFAALLLAAGHTVISPMDGRSGRTRNAAREAGVKMRDSMAAAVAESDLILSLVPPSAVADVAQRAINACRERNVSPVYIDMNAKTPADAERLDAAFSAASLRFCNACVIGRATHLRGEGRIYTSGADTTPLEKLFKGILPVIRLGRETVQATILKMTFTGFNKTMSAALFETANTANAFGVADSLFDLIGRYLGGTVSDFSRLVPTYPRHITRRAEEMEALALMLADQRLPNRIALAAGATFRALDASGSWSGAGVSASMTELLEGIRYRADNQE